MSVVLRENQESIIDNIYNSIYNGNNLIIEAGTGTGKTLAYLISAIMYIKNNNKSVVISTNTINLQEQIINKDIFLAFEYLNTSIDYKIVKGRNNFICVKRFEELYNNKDILSNEHKIEIEEIKKWYDITKTGDRSELKVQISNSLWEKICSSKYFPISKNSIYYDKCFFNKSRNELKKITQKGVLLITNHHLLFSDIMLKNDSNNKILPIYDTIIFDEAHNLESIARQYFSTIVSDNEMNKKSGMLYNIRTNANNYETIFLNLLNLFENYSISIYNNLIEKKDDLIDEIKIIYNEIKNIFNIFYGNMEYNIFTISLNDLLKKVDIIEFEKKIFNIKEHYTNFYNIYNYYYNILNSEIIYNPEINDISLSFLNIYNDYLNDIDNFISILYEAIKENKSDEINNKYAFYIKVNEYEMCIIKSPVEVSEDFKINVVNTINNLVFMSATLSINNDVNYFKYILGLEDSKSIVYKSPFDYNKQMKLFIVKNTTNKNEKEIIDNIKKFIINKNGKTLILFTSYTTLNKYFNLLDKDMKKENILLLKQGSYNRTELINKFKENERSVLLGTDSFWEGIDIIGDSLSNVIIQKLPFKVPTDPVFYKQNIILNENKKSSFNLIQIPHVILKLKQGIGRLIRSEYDSGNIIILDDRLVNSSYGNKILTSLDYVKEKVIKLEDLDEI